MNKSVRRYVEPVQYTVGVDITEERYREAIEKIADWFAQSRQTKEPVVLARQAMQECLEGKKKDGTKWFEMATATLTARVRSKCRFDLETMKPLLNASDRSKRKRQAERNRLARKRAAGDPLLPPEIRKDLKKSATYGDDPRTQLTSDELANWKQWYQDYLKDFPEELASTAARAELGALCDLHVLNDRYRLKMLSPTGGTIDPQERKSIVDQIDKMKTSLGIHPNQVAKRVKDKASTTIGAATAQLEAMGDWRLIRAGNWIAELIQIYQMYHTPSADGLTHQLDEVGLFGLTKCRTCHCSKCGTKNFVGIAIEEIETYLTTRGCLTEVDPASPDPLVPEAEEVWEDEEPGGEEELDAGAEAPPAA